MKSSRGFKFRPRTPLVSKPYGDTVVASPASKSPCEASVVPIWMRESQEQFSFSDSPAVPQRKHRSHVVVPSRSPGLLRQMTGSYNVPGNSSLSDSPAVPQKKYQSYVDVPNRSTSSYNVPGNSTQHDYVRTSELGPISASDKMPENHYLEYENDDHEFDGDSPNTIAYQKQGYKADICATEFNSEDSDTDSVCNKPAELIALRDSLSASLASSRWDRFKPEQSPPIDVSDSHYHSRFSPHKDMPTSDLQQNLTDSWSFINNGTIVNPHTLRPATSVMRTNQSPDLPNRHMFQPATSVMRTNQSPDLPNRHTLQPATSVMRTEQSPDLPNRHMFRPATSVMSSNQSPDLRDGHMFQPATSVMSSNQSPDLRDGHMFRHVPHLDNTTGPQRSTSTSHYYMHQDKLKQTPTMWQDSGYESMETTFLPRLSAQRGDQVGFLASTSKQVAGRTIKSAVGITQKMPFLPPVSTNSATCKVRAFVFKYIIINFLNLILLCCYGLNY